MLYHTCCPVTWCHPVTWYCGYKYSKSCTLYMFLFDCHYYTPIKVKPLKGHLHMYQMENTLKPENVSLTHNYLWDTVTIEWNDVNVLFNFQPIQLPQSVTVPLKHKLKTRTIIDTDFDVQFMIKEGSSWCNITEWLPKKKWKVENGVRKLCDQFECPHGQVSTDETK